LTKKKSSPKLYVNFRSIGCEHQERFRSLYSPINQSQYNLLSSTISSHLPLLLFVIRKPGIGDTCSLLDCHVFAAHRELTAFELCDMIRKLIVKRTMSPILSKRRTIICKHDDPKEPVGCFLIVPIISFLVLLEQSFIIKCQIK